jgi:superfamily II DNA or RNA helicase
MGDFATGELAQRVNIPERNQFIVDQYKKYASGRKSIAFCVDVRHCKDLAETFRRNGVPCEAVYGAMDKQERKQVLRDLKDGKLMCVTTAQLLTEGFNEKSLEVAIMARPTKSKIYYLQAIGRVTRKNDPRPKEAFVLDFTDSYHKLDSVFDLKKALPEALVLDEQDKPIQDEATLKDRSPRIKTKKEVDEEIVFFEDELLWVEFADNSWSLLTDDYCEVIISKVGAGYTSAFYAQNKKTTVLVEIPLDLKTCRMISEAFIKKACKIRYALKESISSNANDRPTEKQLMQLEKMGYFGTTKNKRAKLISKGSATKIIRELVIHRNYKLREKAAHKQI